jgi:hypothetical protein
LDAGDTIIRMNARNAAAQDGGLGPVMLPVPAETTSASVCGSKQKG